MENISELSNNSSYYIHDIKNETNRSQYTTDKTTRLLTAENTALICILCVFSLLGSVGNGLVMYVFRPKAGQYTATIFILALAGTDLIACLAVMPIVISATILSFQFRFDFLCKIYSFLITSILPLSAFIMVAIGVDRYLCICHPFVRIMTVKRAKIIVCILAAFAIVLGIITSLGFSVNNTGRCSVSTAILTFNFIHVYQKLYSSIFLIPLLIVLVLYGMIYRSVFKHRSRKRLQSIERSLSQTEESTVSLNNTIPGAQSPNKLSVMVETIEMNQETGLISMTDKQIGHSDVKTTSPIRRGMSRASTKVEKESVRLANIKTAMILFIVTVVFIVAFLPSWLMSNGWILRNVVLYHMYFVYNVANPFIYAFMNRMFREDVVKMIRSCQRCFHR